MFKKFLAIALMVAASFCGAAAQTLAPPTPIQVERMALLIWANPNFGNAAINQIGLSDSIGQGGTADLIAAQTATFNTTYINLTSAYNLAVQNNQPADPNALMNARDSAIGSAFAAIEANATAQNWSALQAYLNDLTNNWVYTPGQQSDIVAVRKFIQGSTWGDGSGLYTAIFDDDGIIDGYAGQPGACTVSAYTDSMYQGGNSVGNLGVTVPAGTDKIAANFDGTLLVHTSSNGLWFYNGVLANTFQNLAQTGLSAGLEIAGSLTNGIYAIGTDYKLYAHDSINSRWLLTSGAGYPFTTVTHVAAQGSDYSLWAANGATLAAYIPTNNQWITIGTMPAGVTVAQMDSFFKPVTPATANAWFAYIIGSDGKQYVGYYYISNGYKGIDVDTSETGFTGTPLDIHVAQDSSSILHTTTGFFTKPQGAYSYTAVVGQTGSIVTTDSINDIYMVGSDGSLLHQFPSNYNTATFNGYGNQYVYAESDNIVNNFQEGMPFPNLGDDVAVSYCGGVRRQLLQVHTTSYFEWAKTLVFQPVATGAPYRCSSNQIGQQPACQMYSATEDCVASHNPPDLLQTTNIASGTGTPWGFWEGALCISTTGYQPFHCTAASASRITSAQPAFACTAHF